MSKTVQNDPKESSANAVAVSDATASKEFENEVQETNSEPENSASGSNEKRAVWFRPAVNLYTDTKAYYIDAAVPGADEKSVKVSVEKNILSLEAATSDPETRSNADEYDDISREGYRRSFQLDDNVDVDSIEATVKNGVAHIRLPIREPRSISVEIKAG